MADRRFTRAWEIRPLARAAAGLALLAAQVSASPITVNVANRGGALTKAGLGSLFGAANIAGGTSAPRLQGALLYVAQSQGRIGENGSNPYSTEAVAPVIRGTGVKMMCRFNDLCHGFPYVWPGYTEWINQVTAATNSIKNNYADVTYGIAIFNEPDAQLFGTDFMTDPLVGGGTNHDARIDWLWTQTFRVIRGIAPAIKIMGPNYFDYRPQADAAHQTRMRNFLTNAVATATVPDIMGWHSLVFGNPTDVTTALNNYYRPLETELGVPGAPLPISIEEYGINNGAFEGIPGQMVRYWGEFERAKIAFACMGIYENGSTAGNTLRYEWDTVPAPNAGWHMMNWYRTLAGEHVPVTKSTFDGVATWNAAASELTVVFGGSAENTSVQINGLGALGVGSQVRVRMERAEWTTNSHVANAAANQGGDPLPAPQTILDRTFTVPAGGNLTVPARLENAYDGYRLIVSPVAAPAVQPEKYEAELAAVQHADIAGGTVANARASAYGYVGSIDFADSSVTFSVSVPAAGIYRMNVRYAAALGAASHVLTVNGTGQGTVDYAGTAAGWAANELRLATRLVALKQGANSIAFSKGTSYAELDYIDLRPDPHRYQAKLAVTNNVTLGRYANMFMVPDFAGGINGTDSYVEFSAEAPVAGDYRLEITYAKNTTGTAIDSIAINGAASGSISCLPTGGWLSAPGGPGPKRKVAKIVRALAAGWNTIRVQKVSGFAELDYLTIAPYAPATLAQPVWTGAVDGKWDTVTENWKDALSGESGLFASPAPVVFNDAATGATAVVLNQAVSPASTLFNHSALAYTVSGSGKIGGTGGLTKQGAQTLTLATANDYTGATNLTGGSVAVATLADGGSPSGIGAAPAAAGNLVLGGGTLAYTGPAVTIDRGFTVAGAGGGISTTGNLTLAGPAVTTGGNFTKSGPGNLTLARNGPLALGNVSPGVRVQAGTLSLAGAGAQAVTVTGEMWIANVPDVPADLVLNQTALSVSSFLALGRGNGNDGTSHLDATGSTVQTGNFSTGYNNLLANNASEQFVTLTDTTWTNSGVTYLAESAGAATTMTLNGASQYNGSGNFLLGRTAGTTATLALKNGSRVTLAAGYTSIGTAGNGTLNVEGTAIFTAAPNADFNVGDVGPSAGMVNLGGTGAINATQVYIGKNSGAGGTVNQSGGSFQSASFVSIGRFAGGTGSVNVTGGTFTQNGTASPLHVGELGIGTLTISGTGSVVSNGTAVFLGGGSAASGTVNLNGGTLTARRVAEGAGGSSQFNFNGGILRANAGADANFLSGLDAAVVKTGGAFIDTNGRNIGISQVLTGPGALTKSGAGTLLLNAANAFGGATLVSAGTLGGTGSVAGTLAISAGSAIAPGNGTGVFTAGATTIGGSYVCEINGSSADLLVVNGQLAILPGATLDFTVLSAPSGPALVVATYTALSGTFTATGVPAGYRVDYQYDDGSGANHVALVKATAFETWAAAKIAALDPFADASTGGDPDADGLTNLAEFALDGNPLSGAATGKVVGKIASFSGENAFVLTLPVRAGASFSGTTEQVSNPVGGVIYRIQASGGLGAWDHPVAEVTGAEKAATEAGLPALDPGGGWEYRTFKNAAPAATRAFLRAVIASP